MIFLEEIYDLDPAAPKTTDAFIEAAEKHLLGALSAAGGRLIGAFFSHAEWFGQIRQVIGFDDLAALGSFREASRRPGALADFAATAQALAPSRRTQLFEHLGPVSPETLEAGIASAATQPAESYTYAILEVKAGCEQAFADLLAGGAPHLPILASWRPLIGNPRLVVDLWRGAVAGDAYAPSTPQLEAFFGPLREVAPTERIMPLRPLPYSPLR